MYVYLSHLVVSPHTTSLWSPLPPSGATTSPDRPSLMSPPSATSPKRSMESYMVFLNLSLPHPFFLFFFFCFNVITGEDPFVKKGIGLLYFLTIFTVWKSWDDLIFTKKNASMDSATFLPSHSLQALDQVIFGPWRYKVVSNRGTVWIEHWAP